MPEPPALRTLVTRDILQPVVDVMSRLGSPFQGVLYAGLMVADGVPYVLEFNARMGDPETQVVLPLLKTDFLDIIEAVVDHRLEQVPVEWHAGHAVCVVMTSAGYPGAYEVGEPIRGLDHLDPQRTMVFHAGTAKHGPQIVTAGGRVLGVTGRGTSLTDAQAAAYRTAKQITFTGCHYRHDIAYRALAPRT